MHSHDKIGRVHLSLGAAEVAAVRTPISIFAGMDFRSTSSNVNPQEEGIRYYKSEQTYEPRMAVVPERATLGTLGNSLP